MWLGGAETAARWSAGRMSAGGSPADSRRSFGQASAPPSATSTACPARWSGLTNKKFVPHFAAVRSPLATVSFTSLHFADACICPGGIVCAWGQQCEAASRIPDVRISATLRRFDACDAFFTGGIAATCSSLADEGAHATASRMPPLQLSVVVCPPGWHSGSLQSLLYADVS